MAPPGPAKREGFIQGGSHLTRSGAYTVEEHVRLALMPQLNVLARA